MSIEQARRLAALLTARQREQVLQLAKVIAAPAAAPGEKGK